MLVTLCLRFLTGWKFCCSLPVCPLTRQKVGYTLPVPPVTYQTVGYTFIVPLTRCYVGYALAVSSELLKIKLINLTRHKCGYTLPVPQITYQTVGYTLIVPLSRSHVRYDLAVSGPWPAENNVDQSRLPSNLPKFELDHLWRLVVYSRLSVSEEVRHLNSLRVVLHKIMLVHTERRWRQTA